MRGAIPERPRPEQGQRLGEIVAAGAHVGRAPGRERHRARPVAMLLEVALDQQRRRFPPEMPGRGGRHGPAVHREEVAPGRQHVGAAAARRAARSRLDEAAIQRPQHRPDLRRTAAFQRRTEATVELREDGAGRGPFRIRAAAAVDQLAGQQFQPLDRIAVAAPGLVADVLKNRRPRAGPGLRHRTVQRVEAGKAEIGAQALGAPRHRRPRRSRVAP